VNLLDSSDSNHIFWIDDGSVGAQLSVDGLAEGFNTCIFLDTCSTVNIIGESLVPECTEICTAPSTLIKCANGSRLLALGTVSVRLIIGNRAIYVKCVVVRRFPSLLLAQQTLRQLGTIIDMSSNLVRVHFTKMGVSVEAGPTLTREGKVSRPALRLCSRAVTDREGKAGMDAFVGAHGALRTEQRATGLGLTESLHSRKGVSTGPLNTRNMNVRSGSSMGTPMNESSMLSMTHFKIFHLSSHLIFPHLFRPHLRCDAVLSITGEDVAVLLEHSADRRREKDKWLRTFELAVVTIVLPRVRDCRTMFCTVII